MGKNKNAYTILVGKPQEKRPLGRFRRRWEDNTDKYITDRRREDVSDLSRLTIGSEG